MVGNEGERWAKDTTRRVLLAIVRGVTYVLSLKRMDVIDLGFVKDHCGHQSRTGAGRMADPAAGRQ